MLDTHAGLENKNKELTAEVERLQSEGGGGGGAHEEDMQEQTEALRVKNEELSDDLSTSKERVRTGTHPACFQRASSVLLACS